MNKRRIAKFLTVLPFLGFIMLLFLIGYSLMTIGEETSECSKDHKDI
jgi:hypothetical protein